MLISLPRSGRWDLHRPPKVGMDAYVGDEDINALELALLHECGRAGQA